LGAVAGTAWAAWAEAGAGAFEEHCLPQAGADDVFVVVVFEMFDSLIIISV
jgi:formaldehyde-activating enzyme involved in methanogenesis